MWASRFVFSLNELMYYVGKLPGIFYSKLCEYQWITAIRFTLYIHACKDIHLQLFVCVYIYTLISLSKRVVCISLRPQLCGWDVFCRSQLIFFYFSIKFLMFVLWIINVIYIYFHLKHYDIFCILNCVMAIWIK